MPSRRNTRQLAWWLALAASSPVLAQPPPANQGPPPPAPDANWAPPLPVEEPSPPPPPSDAVPPTTAPAPGANPATTTPPPEDGKPELTPAEEPPEQITNTADEASEVETYGFAMLDIGYDFGKIGDPIWQDVIRPTKLPSFTNEFGRGTRTFESVRQSRFGVAMKTPTKAGEIKTKFEFELFGVNEQAGQTTFRLRHFYGKWRGLLGGQTWSPFMDPDVFPDSVEYWGPNGMVFFRTVQLAYTPYENGDSHFTVALEKPGASADTASLVDRVDLESVVPRFPAPDVSADVKCAGGWGYVRAAAIFRYIAWDDLAPTPVVQGHAYGWGVNLSANVKLKPTVLKLQAVYGRAIENYMNDAGADIGPRPSGDPARPVEGVALPVLGLLGFVDVAWNAHFSSTAGYSFVWVDNSEDQTPSAFHIGHYALGNILYHPVKSLFFGPELQFGRRTNNSDGFSVNDYRIQFSIKYSFTHKIGGKP